MPQRQPVFPDLLTTVIIVFTCIEYIEHFTGVLGIRRKFIEKLLALKFPRYLAGFQDQPFDYSEAGRTHPYVSRALIDGSGFQGQYGPPRNLWDHVAPQDVISTSS